MEWIELPTGRTTLQRKAQLLKISIISWMISYSVLLGLGFPTNKQPGDACNTQDRRLLEELMPSINSEALTECYYHVEIVTFFLLSLSCGGWYRYHTHTSRRSRHVNHLGPVARKSRKLFGPNRKVIPKTATRLFCKAGLFICCKANKNENNCKVSCPLTPSLWRYKENYVTSNVHEKFRDFRATGPWSRWMFRHFTPSVNLKWTWRW